MPRTLGNIANRSYSNDFFNYTGIHFGNDNDIKKQNSQIDLQNLSGNCKNYASTSVTFPCLFWGSQALGNEHAGRIGGGHSVHILGHG